MPKNQKYVPALSFDLLTPLYDPLVKLLMPEVRFKNRLIEQARIRAGQRVLDLGCGTATLTILIKQAHPGARVFGLDGDAKVLRIARAKSTKAGAQITFQRGMAFRLPFADNSFDRVLSSMAFHHLTEENLRRTLEEVFRVLQTEGELHVTDFGKPRQALEMLSDIGFDQAEERGRLSTLFGALSFYHVRRPAQRL